MDSPQYKNPDVKYVGVIEECFKPYYKWIVLNTFSMTLNVIELFLEF